MQDNRERPGPVPSSALTAGQWRELLTTAWVQKALAASGASPKLCAMCQLLHFVLLMTHLYNSPP